ncbi:MAG: Rossmann-like domain-containing protein [Anaerolineales bacterium]
MQILDDLLQTIEIKEITKVCIGLNWTAVNVNHSGIERCGIASTIIQSHTHSDEPRIKQAGNFERYTNQELAELSLSDNPTLRSVGIATINASINPVLLKIEESNAADVLASYGKGRRIVLIGRFPFTINLKAKVGELAVIEQDPEPGDYPASKASEIVPQADVVAITGMTLINHTIQDLLDLCKKDAFVMVLGPSAPLSPVLFDYGVDVISGSIVEKIAPVVKVISQGGNFRQVHKAGVRLVNMFK